MRSQTSDDTKSLSASHLSNVSLTPGGFQDSEGDAEIESLSKDHYVDLALTDEKHRLLLRLMTVVYKLLNEDFLPQIITHGSSSEQSSGNRSGNGFPQESSRLHPGRGRKRQKGEEDPRPPGDADGKKRRANQCKGNISLGARRYACPFHKYNPWKYCANDQSAAYYSSCSVSRFVQISHVR